MNSLVIKDHTITGNLPEGISFSEQTLKIAKNKYFEDPIKITLKDDNNESLEIIVGESSEVKIILEIASGDTAKNIYDLKLTAKQNSNVKYLLVCDLASQDATLNHYFTAERDASMDLIGGFVSNVITAKMNAKLIGEGANVNLRAVAISSTDNKQTIDIEIVHAAPNSTGTMHNIAIANSNGKVVLNGVEKILKGMKNANAYQSLKGIIASDQAIIEVNPILLIDEYDVKAGHGATIGKLDENSLYYLMSRGLDKKVAERLMINGFLNPIISEIDDEPLRERFVELVNQRL
ncbi:MAG: hypothetical protein CVV63_00445 [Tenericutes bacterium HGW-Tenericutes-8]|nr:MAG: hypothetical protein CVV63_00445 [Tenericutes bacterium HGW-Tenericutes-8]